MKNILVFPCGSEIGLEIHRSLKYSIHFNLIGGSSVNDHGKFIYENYIGNIPFHNAPEFIEILKNIVRENNIDAIYPAMDAVADTLKSNESIIGCQVIGSTMETNAICASKKKTYHALKGLVPIPKWSENLDSDLEYPLFIKPDVGYGSRNVSLATSKESALNFTSSRGKETDFVFCEYLPGTEYTVDCFSDRHGELLFVGARKRARISNGISVNTIEAKEHHDIFQQYAIEINKQLKPRGAWFFQMKENHLGQPVLLEVAARLGGSSSYFRAKGVNFAMLSVFDAFNLSVAIQPNTYDVELDRALSNRFKINVDYDTAYIDFDDCLLLGDKINTALISFLYLSINRGIRLILITRHAGDLEKNLEKYRLTQIFDEIIHIQDKSPKSMYITRPNAIFVDDSFAERSDVASTHKIPVFSPDMIEALI